MSAKPDSAHSSGKQPTSAETNYKRVNFSLKQRCLSGVMHRKKHQWEDAYATVVFGDHLHPRTNNNHLEQMRKPYHGRENISRRVLVHQLQSIGKRL